MIDGHRQMAGGQIGLACDIERRLGAERRHGLDDLLGRGSRVQIGRDLALDIAGGLRLHQGLQRRAEPRLQFRRQEQRFDVHWRDLIRSRAGGCRRAPSGAAG